MQTLASSLLIVFLMSIGSTTNAAWEYNNRGVRVEKGGGGWWLSGLLLLRSALKILSIGGTAGKGSRNERRQA